MTPNQKSWFWHFVFVPILGSPCLAALVLLNRFDISNSSKVLIILFVLLPLGAVLPLSLFRHVEPFIHALSGYQPPPKAPPTELQKQFGKLLANGIVPAVLALAWLWSVPGRTTPFNAVSSAIALCIGVGILLISNASHQVHDRYLGLGVGLAIAGIVFALPWDSDAPPLLFVLIIGVPSVLGYLFWRWCGSLDFVQERRRKARLEEALENAPPPPPTPQLHTISAPPSSTATSDITEAARKLAEKHK
jgi:hypothetical protein